MSQQKCKHIVLKSCFIFFSRKSTTMEGVRSHIGGHGALLSEREREWYATRRVPDVTVPCADWTLPWGIGICTRLLLFNVLLLYLFYNTIITIYIVQCFRTPIVVDFTLYKINYYYYYYYYYRRRYGVPLSVFALRVSKFPARSRPPASHRATRDR